MHVKLLDRMNFGASRIVARALVSLGYFFRGSNLEPPDIQAIIIPACESNVSARQPVMHPHKVSDLSSPSDR